jgi:hypothetical protein
MSYDVVETGLQGVIRKLSDYGTTNVSKGDYRILGAGVAKAVVLQPGPFIRNVAQAPRRLRQAWVVNLELFIPFTTELSDVASTLRTERQTIMDEVDKWPRLDATAGVIDAFIEGGGEPELWQGENRRWWVQKLRVTIEERTNVTLSE